MNFPRKLQLSQCGRREKNNKQTKKLGFLVIGKVPLSWHSRKRLKDLGSETIDPSGYNKPLYFFNTRPSSDTDKIVICIDSIESA